MLSTLNRLATLSDPFEGVRREFRRGFDGNGNGRGKNEPGFASMSLHEIDAQLLLEVDVPGVEREDLEVTVEKDQLLIRGRRTRQMQNAKNLYDERPCGEFERIVTLDNTIDPGSIDAKLENGVLTVTLSRKPEPQPRRIDVKFRNGTDNG